MHKLATRFLSSFILFLTILGALSAQTSTAVTVLDATIARQVISADAQEQHIRFQNLQKGETYVFVVPPDAALGTCLPTISLVGPTAELIENDLAKHVLRFKALAATAELKLQYPCDWEPSDPPRHYVSIACQTCLAKKTESPLADMSVLEVSQQGAESLVRNIFIGGDCFDVANVTFSGSPNQIGKFSNGQSNIGLATGLIMATGDINIAPGPNDLNGAASGGAGGGDADLSSIATGNLFDVATIEFDFTPTENQLFFSYVFASEEYCEYVSTSFNDVFGFFISGPGIVGTQNLAVVPSTNIPVSINTINHISNQGLYTHNTPAGLDNCESGGVIGNLPPVPPATGPGPFELQYDGFAKKMIAVAQLIPCSTYHIKLAIGDVGDGLWDAAVFLQANSFDAGGNVAAYPVYPNSLPFAPENCGQSGIRFVRGNGDLSLPLVVSFSIAGSSTATSGVDYGAFANIVVIPSGQSEVFLPINVIADGIVEGQEFIDLLINNNCQCQQAHVEFLINDSQTFLAQVVQDTTVCEGFPAPLFADSDGEFPPFTYVWNTGDTSQAIVVYPLVSSTYTVTVTDACGGTATAEGHVDVLPIVRDTMYIGLCSGGSVEVNGIVYTDAAVVTDTSYQVFFCGQISTHIITLSDPVAGSQTISLCPGDTVQIGGMLYSESGTVIDTLSTLGGCDSIVTYTLVALPYTFGADTISLCHGDTIVIGGQIYFDAGTVLDTIPAVGGCDSIVTHTLILLPQPTLIQLISFCPGESVVLGGISYTQPTTVVLTLPGILGCDTIATYKLELLPQPTLSKTIKFCPGDTVLLGGNVYTQPGTVVLTLPASVGCDTMATYTIESIAPAPSTVTITCAGSSVNQLPTGTNAAVVTYVEPSATTDCPCPGITITRTSGLASGSLFPLGISQVCYTARDVCGQTKSCCFSISVEEEGSCDIKVIGCLKYELLTITQDIFKNKTYRIRVTNNCPSPMTYTAIQLPSALVALDPGDNTIYTAPSGNDYLVRNPNYSPFYSVRFRSVGTGIANGASDILRYTLPAQADVKYIHIFSRLDNQQSYEAHMNTFYCPVGSTPTAERDGNVPGVWPAQQGSIQVFPNPSDGNINVDLGAWAGQKVQVKMFNSQGQLVLQQMVTAALEPLSLELSKTVVGGLYVLEVCSETGEKEAIKVVISKY